MFLPCVLKLQLMEIVFNNYCCVRSKFKVLDLKCFTCYANAEYGDIYIHVYFRANKVYALQFIKDFMNKNTYQITLMLLKLEKYMSKVKKSFFKFYIFDYLRERDLAFRTPPRELRSSVLCILGIYIESFKV